MLIKKISPREVKECFILANAFKKIAKNHVKLGISDLEDNYLKLIENLKNLDERELEAQIPDKVRVGRYNSMNWYSGEKDLSEMGVWPKMRGLDILLTTGNVIETVRGVRSIIEGKSDLCVPQKFREKIRSMGNLSEFIYPRFPLILFPGGEVREKDYNAWARENNLPLCSCFNFDIDDGCSRAVIYFMQGKHKANVLLGKYKR